MLSVFKAISDGLNKIYFTVAMVLLAVLLGASSIQVLSRYFLNISQTWTEELARYCFIWSGLLGATVLTKTKGHAVVDFAVKRLRGAARKIQQAILCVIACLIGAVLFCQGLGLMSITAVQRSPSLGIPMSVVYFAIPACGIGICVHMLCEMMELFFGGSDSGDTA